MHDVCPPLGRKFLVDCKRCAVFVMNMCVFLCVDSRELGTDCRAGGPKRGLAAKWRDLANVFARCSPPRNAQQKKLNWLLCWWSEIRGRLKGGLARRGGCRNGVLPRIGPPLAGFGQYSSVQKLVLCVTFGKTSAPGGPQKSPPKSKN